MLQVKIKCLKIVFALLILLQVGPAGGLAFACDGVHARADQPEVGGSITVRVVPELQHHRPDDGGIALTRTIAYLILE